MTCALACVSLLGVAQLVATRQLEQKQFADILAAAETAASLRPVRSGVGAYYPCGRSAEVVRPVLRRFRRIYPGSPVLLHDDHGRADLVALAATDGATYLRGVSKSWTGHTTNPFSTEAMMDMLDGAARVAAEPGVRWVVFLEDDVAFIRPPDVDTDCRENDVCCMVLHIPAGDADADAYLRTHHTMQGGCFIRASMLTRMAGASRSESTRAFERSRDVTAWRHIPTDAALTMAAAAANATFGAYGGRVTLTLGFGTGALERAVESGELTVVHGLKNEYAAGIWMFG